MPYQLCFKNLHLEATALKGPSASPYMLVCCTFRPKKPIGCLQGVLRAVFQHVVQEFFVCGDCNTVKTLGEPQPGWLLHLSIQTSVKLVDALEAHFMASNTDSKVECAAT